MRMKRKKAFRLSSEEIGVIRQLLGQLAPTPDGNVIKLREKLYAPLDGTDVMLTRSEVRFLHDLLDALQPIDEDDRPIPKDEILVGIVAKLSAALKGRAR